MDAIPSNRQHSRTPWNKGKLVGQKTPFKPRDIWAMRIQLQQRHRTRELALLNLGLDSKLRACDLVALKVRDITHGAHVAARAIVQQHKTGRPVQFEITAAAREAKIRRMNWRRGSAGMGRSSKADSEPRTWPRPSTHGTAM